MFDFTTETSPSQIIIPSLYHSASTSYPTGADKENFNHDNIDQTIASVVGSYASSRTHHRRQRSYALSIGVGHPPQSMKLQSIQHSRPARDSRPPLSIHIPNIAPLNPIRKRIFNTPRISTPVTAIPSTRSNLPSLQAVSDWVASSHKRARESRERGSKIVAHRILALHTPRPNRLRLPPSEIPRPYVKSSLSQSFSLESL